MIAFRYFFFYFHYIHSSFVTVRDLYKNIEELVIKQIENNEYYLIDKNKKAFIYAIDINNESFVIRSKKDSVILRYADYIKISNRDFLVDLIYTLYSKKDASCDKILIFNIQNSYFCSLKSFFNSIPDSTIKTMIEKFEIDNFVPEYLEFVYIISDNIFIYDNLILKKKTKIQRIGNSILFYISTKNLKCFFRFSIEDITLDYHINELIQSEYRELKLRIHSITRRIPAFRLQEIFNFLNFDDRFLYSQNKLEKSFRTRYLRHSLLQNSTTKTILFIIGNPNFYLNDIFNEKIHSNIFYVYTSNDILGINKTVYTFYKDAETDFNDTAFCIKKEAFDEILDFFEKLRDRIFLDIMSIRMVFYSFKKSRFYKNILEKCLSDRGSANFIIILHLMKYCGIITHSDFLNLMVFDTNQICSKIIYDYMIKNLIEDIISKPLFEIMSTKCLLFQFFVIEKIIKLSENEKKLLLDNENYEPFGDISLLDEFLVCRDIVNLVGDSNLLYTQIISLVSEITCKIADGVKNSYSAQDNEWIYPDSLVEVDVLDQILEGLKYSKARDLLREKLRLCENYENSVKKKLTNLLRLN